MAPSPVHAVAIVGLGCRLPGAANSDEFWRNLRDGVESVRTLSRDELLAAGAPLSDLLKPNHVPAGALVADIDKFDAAFFGIPAREAEIMDPQHRLFLECAWETLEDAGCDPARYEGAISVFGGGIFDSYLTWNVLPAGVFDDKSGALQTIIANEKDYMTSRVAYKLNLRGAACNVQAGCSTSLVAVHLACQSLLNYESDLALAGGVAVDVERLRGYFHHEGSVFSPDGHCRAFDADARGTVFGNGVAIVALKRLEDAVADGDAIRAIVLGTAINNDGSLKVGFTAPGVYGQSQVIVEALAAAGVGPETIGYVETHGTGTPLGDPIEIQAMAKAFASAALPPGACPIGSVKTNIGHLDAAAGAAGLIKTVLALQHGLIPPTLHFRRANPELGLHETPFTVAAEARPWTSGASPGVPRRAGISSFGIGGTNAHAILEEAPAPQPSRTSRPQNLLVLSARTPAALEASAGRLAEYLRAHPDVPLADVAFTLQSGRAQFAHRLAFACRDTQDALRLLEAGGPGERAARHEYTGAPARVAFVFPGQGAQYPGMARALYEGEPAFRKAIDACASALGSAVDIAGVIDGRLDAAAVTATAVAQPALFAVEYALAELWRHWGVEPDALIGHSIGEYVAACLADVFSPADAIRLVAQRGRLMQSMPAGAMTAVSIDAAQLRLPAASGVEIAAVNGPRLTVVAGSIDAVEAFEASQRGAGVECRRLHTSHAFHSAAMDPIVGAFADAVAAVGPRPPQRRFVSNVTGTWITDSQAADPAYWARHLRAPVLFGPGLSTLLGDGIDLVIEAGPGRAAAALARAQQSAVAVLSSLPAAGDPADAHGMLLNALGRAWMRGAPVAWTAFHDGERRRRVSLPTYPFERQRHWIEPDEKEVERRRARVRANEKRGDVTEWLYGRSWNSGTWPVAADTPADAAAEWLLLADASGVSQQIVAALRQRIPADRLTVSDEVERAAAVAAGRGAPLRIVHLGLASAPKSPGAPAADLDEGFFSMVALAGSLARAHKTQVTVKVVTAGVDMVFGTETVLPERATVIGPCLVLPQEQPHVRCQRVDIPLSSDRLAPGDEAALVAELLADAADPEVAIRGGRRWRAGVLPLRESARHPAPIRENGHYVIVGGLGTIGGTMAFSLARHFRARLTLIGRTAPPARAAWEQWTSTHAAGDRTSIRIALLAALEKCGSEVLPIAADVSDPAALRRAFEEAERAFGPISGLIAAAGVMDEQAFAPLDRTHRAAALEHFRPKLAGLPAIAEALGDRPLEFAIVASSLSTLLGGVGYGMYAAANAFLDAFVHQQNAAHPGRWFGINWDAWHPLGGELPAGTLLARLAMTPAEGANAFEALLKCRGMSQAFVSTADLEARLAAQREARPASQELPEADAAASRAREQPAPGAATPDVTPTERAIIGIWEQVLGAPGVQLHDTFLDLGGSSLTAIQVISRITEELGVRVTIEEFIFQTAGQLASICDARRSEPAAVAAAVPVADPASPAAGRGWARLRTALRTRGTAKEVTQ